MINLETPKKFMPLVSQAHQVAVEVFRPISRKYDLAEHEYPKELDILAAIIDGVNAGGASRASAARRIASISPRDAERPFIFQFPATNGRTPGVIEAFPHLGWRGCYHRAIAYAKRPALAR